MLKDLDLNLLIYVDVVLEELSITKAAKRLSITQAALSNALARARLLLEDELLVRSGRDMVPTRFALEIKGPLRRAIDCLSHEVLRRRTFDPKKDSFQFLTAFHGYEEALLLPDLLAALTQYPRLSLFNQSPKSAHVVEALAEGSIHFTISPTTKTNHGIVRKKLLTDSFVCVVNSNFAKKSLELSEYCEQRHLMIALHGGRGQVDIDLEKLGKNRFIAVTVGEFSNAPLLLCKDKTLVTTVPKRLAHAWQEYFPLHIFPCPLQLEVLPLYLSWHQSSENVPELIWFKSLLEGQIKDNSNI